MSTTKNVRSELTDLTKNAKSGVLKVTEKGVTVAAGNTAAAGTVVGILSNNKVQFGATSLRKMDGKDTWFIPVNFPVEFKAVKEFTVVEKSAKEGVNVMGFVAFYGIVTSPEFIARCKAELDAAGNPQFYIKDDETKAWTRVSPVKLGWISSKNDYMTSTHFRTLQYRIALALYANGKLTEADLSEVGFKANTETAKKQGRAAKPATSAATTKK